jgi:hypothetical protein
MFDGSHRIMWDSINAFLSYIMMYKNWPSLCVFWILNADLFFLQVCACALLDSFIDYCIHWLLQVRNSSSVPTFQILLYAAISYHIDGWLSNSSSIGRKLPLASAFVLHVVFWVGELELIWSMVFAMYC